MIFSCRSFTVIIMLLVLTLMPGCGRKTDLIPPQKLVPVAISDLRYFLDETGVSLKARLLRVGWAKVDGQMFYSEKAA